jgi:hypothetical protein
VECKILLLIAEFPAEHSRLAKKKTLEHAELLCETLCLGPFADASLETSPPGPLSRGWLGRITQWEMIELMHGLASMWNRLEPDVEALSNLVDALQLSVAPLIYAPHGEERLDGKLGVHRVPYETDPVSGTRTFRVSAEFISDMVSVFSSLWRSLHVAEILCGDANQDLAQRSEPLECIDLTPRRGLCFSGTECTSTPVWEGYRAREADNLLPLWSIDQLSNSNQAGFYDKLKRVLSQFCQRPGDKEKHTRANSNTEAQDPTSVLETTRTPAFLDLFFNGLKYVGVVSMLRGVGMYGGLLRGCSLAKIFDVWFDRVSNSKFSWWANVLLMEKDFLPMFDQVLDHADEPQIVQVMQVLLMSHSHVSH